VNVEVIPLRGGEKAPAAGAVSQGGRPRMVPLEEMERDHIEAVLKGNNYNKFRTAEILGISRRTLDRRIADFGLMDAEG